jgi:hydroxylamine reductase
MSMFCYQCEQSAKGSGCTTVGVCGKTADVAAMQDLLMYGVKGLAMYEHRNIQLGIGDKVTGLFIVEILFTTVTNVNFDVNRLATLALKTAQMRDNAKVRYTNAFKEKNGVEPAELGGATSWQPGESVAEMIAQGMEVSIQAEKDKFGEDVTGLRELIIYGLKGTAAYADHAYVLGQEDDSVYAFFAEALNFIAEEKHDLNQLVGMTLKVGEVNLKVMELLDSANTGTYGHPSPTSVRVTPVAGKAILVSGHDLLDLKILLEQTEGKGINIYTHGEMLPAHGYPELRKYSHLVGNYGGAWQDQAKEFDAFPGAILMTTNCIQKPRDSYQSRIFTTGLVAWPDVTHISEEKNGSKDFSGVIDAALMAPGFITDEPEQTIMVGFGHNAVLGVAPVVIDAVKAGKIRHFFLIGGCDGAKSGRNYYTDLATSVPDDCVILTLACGKFRFNKLPFGDIGGIPRLLDIGQCNDAYSAIKIAVALAEAFGIGVNELPLSMVLSWYEQKACCILLTLLYLGIKDIRLGPSLPAFITPAVLDVLVQNFNIMPITTPEADLKAILG